MGGHSMRGMAFIALAVLATSMIVEDATAVDSSEQKDLTQLLSSDQACHQKGFGSRQHAFAKCPISLLGEVSVDPMELPTYIQKCTEAQCETSNFVCSLEAALKATDETGALRAKGPAREALNTELKKAQQRDALLPNQTQEEIDQRKGRKCFSDAKCPD